ncbi:MAG: ABC transporter substrate-binding protein [Clostridia bacterium]
MKKILALMFALITLALCILGCSKISVGTVCILCESGESAEVYNAIAKEYSKLTGVAVSVKTVASGDYESSLKNMLIGDSAPSLFFIRSDYDLKNLYGFCYDLTNSKLYQTLFDKSFAFKSDGNVSAIPIDIEGFGLIYNKKIMDRYFALPTKTTDIDSIEKIKNFDTLKNVVEDMTANKALIGIDGVFSSTPLSPGSQWILTTQLFNIPLYYEFQNQIDNAAPRDTYPDFEFKYKDNYKSIFDLYTDNSVTPKNQLSRKTISNAMAEFALGKCAMVQNGDFSISRILDITGNTVNSDDIKFIPIYMGMNDESSRGLCISVKQAFCVNDKVKNADKEASLKFMEWLFTDQNGLSYATKNLRITPPFITSPKPEIIPKPLDNPLSSEIIRYINLSDFKSIKEVYSLIPSEDFKAAFGKALVLYTNGRLTWDEVVEKVNAEFNSKTAPTAVTTN